MENLNYLKVALIQSSLYWEDKNRNLGLFGELLRRVSSDTRLVVLPEMFNTGFSMNSEKLAEEPEGPTVEWMARNAAKLGKAIVGSLIVKEDSKYYNRLIWMNPDETYFHYDKRHLFRMADEHEHFSAGTKKLVLEYRDWRICPLVCYDLRFPVWSRNTDNYDMLIYVANWPHKRISHWDTLLNARAIENQCYVLGVNRVGTDGNGISYSGHSQVISHTGHILAQENDHDSIIEFTLNKQIMLDYRQQFPAWKDRDEFQIKSEE